MLVTIIRRNPSGTYDNVEPDGLSVPNLDSALRYYHDNFADDDAEGTEIIFAWGALPLGASAGGPARVHTHVVRAVKSVTYEVIR